MAKRFKTIYPGVFYIEGKRAGGGVEKNFYIRFKKDGRDVEEKAGRQFQDNMTPAKAAGIRSERMEGRRMSRKQMRVERSAKRAETLGHLWESFAEAKSGNKSFKDDAARWRVHLRDAVGSKAPSKLITLDVDRLRTRLLKKKSPQTVKHVLVLLKRIINFSVRRGLCAAPDHSRLHFEMPRVDNVKTEDLTPEELERLLRAVEDEPNRQVANLMLMALFTGMRRGELFRLKWEHVDFERGFISLVDTKGGVDQKIPLNTAARTLLENHEVTGSPYVFPGRGGNQRVDIRRQVSKVRDRAGLPKDFRPLHGLRHVYASMLASSGQVDMYALQKLMTHKSAAMTQRYAHLRDDALKRAGNVAGDIFNNLGKGKEKKVVNLDAFRDDS